MFFRSLLGQAVAGTQLDMAGKSLREFDLGIDFLVCGFGDQIQAQMFLVGNPGRIRPLGQLDYWAIGKGDYMALASLALRPIGTMSVEDVVYRACEAKFIAESSNTVGPDTTVSIMDSAGQQIPLLQRDVETMRERYQASRSERAPKEIIDLLQPRLKHLQRLWPR